MSIALKKKEILYVLWVACIVHALTFNSSTTFRILAHSHLVISAVQYVNGRVLSLVICFEFGKLKILQFKTLLLLILFLIVLKCKYSVVLSICGHS